MGTRVLLERNGELARIIGSLDRVRDGAGGAMLIEGPGGIGKTALLETAVASAAQRSFRVALARGGQFEIDFPFGVARQAFEPLLSGLAEPQRRRALSGAAALAAPIIGPQAPAFSGEDRSFAALHGLYWLTANLAESGPLLLAVDDLHWADAPSLRFVHYLIRRLEGLPVWLLLSARSGDPASAPAVLAGLHSEPLVSVVRPAPLSEAAVGVLIRERLDAEPDEAFTDACLSVTGGMPFLLHELLNALAEGGISPSRDGAQRIPEIGPSTVAHATLLRLSHQGEPAVALAQAVAVLGPAAERRLAAQLAGLDLDVALEAADALVAMHVFRAGDPLGFSHPIVRAAVHEDLSEGQRATMHGRAAELLAAEKADPDAIAAHLMLSAPAHRAEVVERLREAAAGALARGAPENAVGYLTRALGEGVAPAERSELLVELAGAERLGNPQGAAEHLAEALRISEDPQLRARASILLAVLLTFAGRWVQSLSVVDAALAELGDRNPVLGTALRGFAAAFTAYDPEHVERFQALRGPLLEALDAGVPSAYGPAMVTSMVDTLLGQRTEQAGERARRCLGHPGLLDDEREIGLIPQGLTALVYLDENEAAETAAARLLDSARRRGSLQGMLTGMSFQAWVRARQGELVSAQADLVNLLAQVQEHGLLFVLPPALSYAVDVALERPDAEPIAALAMSLELPPDFARTFSGALVLFVRGQLKLARGDRSAAQADLRACAEICEPLGFVNPNGLAWRSALGLAVSEPREARALIEAELAVARRVGQPRGLGLTLRRLARVAEPAESIAMLEESLSVLETSPARLELARTMVDLGASRRRQGERRRAREHLADGLELAVRCGAVRLADSARQELRATGARPRRELRSGMDALTPSELRVAQLAAKGASNPEIAQALFVSRNTIETHMRHVFQKLGIGARSELQEALGMQTERRLPPAPELS